MEQMIVVSFKLSPAPLPPPSACLDRSLNDSFMKFIEIAARRTEWTIIQYLCMGTNEEQEMIFSFDSYDLHAISMVIWEPYTMLLVSL